MKTTYTNLVLVLLLAGSIRVLSHAEKAGGDFHNFIFVEVFDATIQSHVDSSNNSDLILRAGSTHVVQLLCLANVDLQITWTLVDTDTARRASRKGHQTIRTR